MNIARKRRAEFLFKSRADLDVMLTNIAQQIPSLLKQHPNPSDFWPRFAVWSDEILAATGAEDDQYVCLKLDAILSANGLVPRDDIQAPCSTGQETDV